jgi:hypothetical protein
VGENPGDPGEQFYTDAVDQQLHFSWTGLPNDRSDSKLNFVESISRLLGNEIPSPQVNHDRFTTSGRFNQ